MKQSLYDAMVVVWSAVLGGFTLIFLSFLFIAGAVLVGVVLLGTSALSSLLIVVALPLALAVTLVYAIVFLVDANN